MKKSISIVIPMYNEEKNLESSIIGVDNIAKRLFDDYELLVFDDFSQDRTGEIADRLAKENRKIKVFHNNKNMNVGYNYRMGIRQASKEYVMLLPSPDSVTIKSIENFMRKIGEADLVIAYVGNKKARPLNRRVISYLVTIMINILFGLRLKYFFGIQGYKTRLVKNIKISTNSFASLSEIPIRLIKKNYLYKELPVYTKKIENEPSRAFRIKNVVGVISLVFRLFFEIHFAKIIKKLSKRDSN